jgi:outer membrane protein assembly factor BamD (BamD/ComL family)
MKKLVLFLLVSIALPWVTEATYTFKNGKLTKSEEVATLSVQEHYSAAIEAFQKEQWEELVHQMVIVVKNFPASPFAQEAYYYLGVGYFHLKEFEFSNRFFSKYLKKHTTPKFFEEAIQYKYQIAEKYQSGAKKHILGLETMPKWLPAAEEAIAIYEEVITALPHHDLAARSLFGKAQLLLKDEEYKSSIETYQLLIRRFPKHPLAIEGYIGIEQVYLVQSKEQYPDQDYLDLAAINLNKFRASFPKEERIAIAEEMFGAMLEVYASDLYDTARFYERTHKPKAAHLYYTRILNKYPETQVAFLAKKRLGSLKVKDAIEGPGSENEVLPSTEVIPHSETPSVLDLPVQPGLIVDAEALPSSGDIQ